MGGDEEKSREKPCYGMVWHICIAHKMVGYSNVCKNALVPLILSPDDQSFSLLFVSLLKENEYNCMKVITVSDET